MSFKIIKEWFTDEMINSNPNIIFVFGDNLERRGRGGQAAVCRGKPNCFGIPTKRNPFYNQDSFMSDTTEYFQIIDCHFNHLEALLEKGKTVYWPADGIGTGRANLVKVAPKLLQHIQRRAKELEKRYS